MDNAPTDANAPVEPDSHEGDGNPVVEEMMRRSGPAREANLSPLSPEAEVTQGGEAPSNAPTLEP